MSSEKWQLCCLSVNMLTPCSAVPGHFCVQGADAPAPCTAGSYQNETRQDACETCPQGFHCPINTTVPISCPSGYWCPAASTEPYTNPCPRGTYNNLTERYQDTSCLSCPPGWVLDQLDLVAYFKKNNELNSFHRKLKILMITEKTYLSNTLELHFFPLNHQLKYSMVYDDDLCIIQ